MPRWRTILAADNKAASGAWDPVTEADRRAEQAMRDMLAAEYPDHGVDGEEFPQRPAAGALTWSLDPVDGTRAFVCGPEGGSVEAIGPTVRTASLQSQCQIPLARRGSKRNY